MWARKFILESGSEGGGEGGRGEMIPIQENLKGLSYQLYTVLSDSETKDGDIMISPS